MYGNPRPQQANDADPIPRNSRAGQARPVPPFGPRPPVVPPFDVPGFGPRPQAPPDPVPPRPRLNGRLANLRLPPLGEILAGILPFRRQPVPAPAAYRINAATPFTRLLDGLRTLGLIYLILLGVGLFSQVLTPMMSGTGAGVQVVQPGVVITSAPIVQNPTVIVGSLPQQSPTQMPPPVETGDGSAAQAAVPAVPLADNATCTASAQVAAVQAPISPDADWVFTVDPAITGCLGRTLRVSLWVTLDDGSPVKSAGSAVYFRDVQGNLTSQTLFIANGQGSATVRLGLPDSELPATVRGAQIYATATLRDELTGTILATSARTSFNVPR